MVDARASVQAVTKTTAGPNNCIIPPPGDKYLVNSKQFAYQWPSCKYLKSLMYFLIDHAEKWELLQLRGSASLIRNCTMAAFVPTDFQRFLSHFKPVKIVSR